MTIFLNYLSSVAQVCKMGFNQALAIMVGNGNVYESMICEIYQLVEFSAFWQTHVVI